MRKCYKCGADITNEPALEGAIPGALLCFPCRYRLDLGGGEAFDRDSHTYPQRHAEWKARHGAHWWTLRGFDYTGRGIMGLGCCSVYVFLIFGRKLAEGLGIPLFLLLALGLVAASCVPAFIFAWFERRLPCPGPPPKPRPPLRCSVWQTERGH